MAFSDLFKKFINADDEGFDEVEAPVEQDFETTTFSANYENDYEAARAASRQRRQTYSNDSNRVVDIRTTAMLQVVLVKPDKFEDARAIADHLNEKRTVVLNLESVSKDVARRLIDFLTGVAYANNGQIKRVANSTFMITPFNVDLMGELLDELESSGVYF